MTNTAHRDLVHRANTASALARQAEHEAADEPSKAALRDAAVAHRDAAASHRVAATTTTSPNARGYHNQKALEHDRLAKELGRTVDEA